MEDLVYVRYMKALQNRFVGFAVQRTKYQIITVAIPANNPNK